MKTIKLNIYTIDELKNINKKAFDKVIEKQKDDFINMRFDFAADDARDILKDKYKIDNVDDVYYSISYCQGDGFCFIAHDILSYQRLSKKDNMDCFEKWINDNVDDDKINDILEYLNCGYNLKIKKTDFHYCHKYTCDIDYEVFYSSDDPEKLDRINDVIFELCTLLYKNVYCVVCDDIEKYLYSFYDVDDDDILEYLNENDFMFYDDGELY